ncbi:MAG TPA: histidine phosphatase family protein, partial [Sporichthya sp.]|nr:histidine phosphatase family protein [Sporichthya sp.]
MSTAMTGHTIVHVVRHGEVFNPEGVLYGRLPGYHLSELGVKMAERIAETFAGADIAALVSSPLER